MGTEPAFPSAAPPPRGRVRLVASVLLLVVAVGLLAFYAGTLQAGPKASPTPGIPVDAREVRLKLPAVDSEGNGVVAHLTARVQPVPAGAGKVLVSVNDAKPAPDTQLSALTAARVASNVTGRGLGSVDIVFSVQADAQVVEGPSAGAAMAVAAAAALEGRAVRPDVAITGSVEPDGTVGQVGAIEEKARAARREGAVLFLVPRGQNTAGVETRPVRECEVQDSLRFCRVDFAEVKVDLGGRVGLQVAEVATVREALNHFYGSG